MCVFAHGSVDNTTLSLIFLFVYLRKKNVQRLNRISTVNCTINHRVTNTFKHVFHPSLQSVEVMHVSPNSMTLLKSPKVLGISPRNGSMVPNSHPMSYWHKHNHHRRSQSHAYDKCLEIASFYGQLLALLSGFILNGYRLFCILT